MTCSLKSFQIFIGDVCLVDFDSITWFYFYSVEIQRLPKLILKNKS